MPEGAGVWIVQAVAIPVVSALFLWVRTLVKEKDALQEKRIETLERMLQNYNDAVRVVEASFELQKEGKLVTAAFQERVTEYIQDARNFQANAITTFAELKQSRD